jgi:hypothetical protein
MTGRRSTLAGRKQSSCGSWIGLCAALAVASPAVALDATVSGRASGLPGALAGATTLQVATLAITPAASAVKATASEPAVFPRADLATTRLTLPGRSTISTVLPAGSTLSADIPAGALAGLEVHTPIAPHAQLVAMPQHLYMGKRGVGLKFGF